MFQIVVFANVLAINPMVFVAYIGIDFWLKLIVVDNLSKLEDSREDKTIENLVTKPFMSENEANLCPNWINGFSAIFSHVGTRLGKLNRRDIALISSQLGTRSWASAIWQQIKVQAQLCLYLILTAWWLRSSNNTVSVSWTILEAFVLKSLMMAINFYFDYAYVNRCEKNKSSSESEKNCKFLVIFTQIKNSLWMVLSRKKPASNSETCETSLVAVT